MTGNPFEPLAPRPTPQPLQPAPRLAYGVALAAALASVLAWCLGWLTTRWDHAQPAPGLEGWLVGPFGLLDLAFGVLVAWLTGLMTCRFWFESRAIAAHHRPRWLLAGVLLGGALLPWPTASLLYGLWFSLDAGPLEWLVQRVEYRNLFLLIFDLLDGLTWLLCGPLLLLALLALGSRQVPAAPLARAVPRWEMAVCFGACIALWLVLLVDLFSHALYRLTEPEARLMLRACALALGGLAMGVNWRLLPLRGRRLHPLRLLGACLVCVLLWLLLGALLGALLVVLVLLDERLFLPLSLLLGGGLLLALILLSRFCLRLIYRPRPG